MAAKLNSYGFPARINSWLRLYHVVLYSTPASVRARWPSVFACVEIAVAVTTYWWIAIRFETQKHLWISVCVAPLLLLRSKESIALGLKWFKAAYRQDDPVDELPIRKFLRTKRPWVTTGCSALFYFAVFYFTAKLWLAYDSSPYLFWSCAFIAGWVSCNIGFAVAMTPVNWIESSSRDVRSAVCGFILASIALWTLASIKPVVFGSNLVMAAGLVAINLSKVQLALIGAVGMFAATVLLFGMVSSCAIRAGWMRFWATLRYFPAGLEALPTNWSRTMFATDFAHPPELMPGYNEPTELNFNVTYRRAFNSSHDWGDDRAFNVYLACLIFLPALLYRLSIKSTFWLYWPLAYIANDARGTTRPEVVFDKLSATPLAWLSALVAAATFIGFIAANLFAHFATLWPASRVAFQVAAIEFLFQLDWASQKPWVWFSLASAAITICLFLWAGQMRPEMKYGNIDQKTSEKIHHHALWMKRLARLRLVCTILLTVSLLLYFLLWRSPVQCLLGEFQLNYVLGLFRWYFGTRMPEGPACG